ncbi:SDR family NAD(P)-dependent oxidoreductase [Roseibium limicola]|uniref:Glucose 1-dehydrogenase n=1 Tax=Roseibium limicola TaxID=2816037 RepID=A0A939EN12_9HYPH|nr:glucose 1-dehydrogenase [Roseibium limicola]MBO0345566.1 glucose 1-dehydrogenase [Roseibium limicola]
MNLTQDLNGKRVLITGASSGLGEHFARLCAKSGAYVGIAARRTDRLDELEQELVGLGASGARAIELDVSDGASIHACRAKAVEAFGGLDLLVNNAGIIREGRALDKTAEDFDAVMDVNLRGVWLMAISCGRHWRDSEEPGNIINIASTAGIRVRAELASYSVSKAGVIQMTKAMALEFARHNVRVNALAPGYFETGLNEGFFQTDKGERLLKQIPMRRKGEMQDLDGPFLLLASDASSYMTGAVIPIDGGLLVAS